MSNGLYMSPGCVELWELEPQEAQQNVTLTWQMVHPDELLAMRASVLTSAQTLQPWNWEWRILTPSGRCKWLKALAKPHRQANGDTIWDGLILDISDRKRAEEALRDSENRYRLLAENTNDLVCLHDLEGRYCYVSPSCKALLQERNIQISIDDFGTGYSSLNYLHRLPVNNLKVDRTFVNQIQPDNPKHQIVATIAALTSQLELDATAEGIETQDQLVRLQQLGYKFGQGYLFSKPLPPAAATHLLSHHSSFFS